MSNAFRYASVSYAPLPQNEKHDFAARHALCLYRANAVYSFIPKNACSTMRYSLAIENGCIEGPADINWIHKNNDTFRADLRSLASAAYKFAILRCPYSRLASVYLDKIVGRDVEAWSLYEQIKRRIALEEITFEKFVALIAEPGTLAFNNHWRPQVDFLVYQSYDDLFQLENFAATEQALLAKCGLKVHDARNLTRHGIDGLEKLPASQAFCSVSPVEIFRLRHQGKVPAPISLYNDGLVKTVARLYQQDLELYTRCFGAERLLFKP